MKETITMHDVLKIVRKRLLYIISFALFAALITAFTIVFIIKPTYQAETQLLVNQKNTEPYLGAQNVETDLRLINTYNIVIKSPAILSKVISELGLDMTPEVLMEKINVSNANNSQVVNIIVKDRHLETAVDIANTLAKVFQLEIPILMTVDNINILSVAKVSEKTQPVSPNKLLCIVAASLMAFIVSVVFAVLLEILDTTIKTEQDIEETVGLPIIGLISQISDHHVKSARIKT